MGAMEKNARIEKPNTVFDAKDKGVHTSTARDDPQVNKGGELEDQTMGGLSSSIHTGGNNGDDGCV